MSLKGKTLFITGASRGIGLAIGLRAARDGANVAIAAKTAEPHPKLPGTIYTAADEIEKSGGQALPLVCDIRFEDQVGSAVEACAAKFGGIDILVNNASAIQLTGTLQTDMKRYDLMNGINARGTYLVSRTAIPHLKRARYGRTMVQGSYRVHDGQVRDEHVRARHGGGIQRRGYCLQCVVAAHRHCHSSHPQCTCRR